MLGLCARERELGLLRFDGFLRPFVNWVSGLIACIPARVNFKMCRNEMLRCREYGVILRVYYYFLVSE